MGKLTKPDNLTDKQWAFVLEYPKDWNATQAAIRAGYSKNTASEIGYENLTKPQIREALQAAYEAATMSLEEALAGISKIARDEDNDLQARLRAYEMIGRRNAAFTDKIQGEQITHIIVDVQENDE